jgi:hypothetical protein
VRSLLRVALGVLIGLVLLLVPLLVVQRSVCREDGRRVDSWSAGLPFSEPPRGCRDTTSGAEELINFFSGS